MDKEISIAIKFCSSVQSCAKFITKYLLQPLQCSKFCLLKDRKIVINKLGYSHSFTLNGNDRT